MNNKTNLIIGIVIILTPFSGFPRDIKTFIFIVAGLIIVIYALKRIRLENKKKNHHHRERHKDVFVESKPAKITPPVFEEKFEVGSENIEEVKVESSQNISSDIANNE